MWLADDKYSIYELVAIGGMGKSALTWYWMTQEVLATAHNEFDGVMWWSFYNGESSFTKFVDEALVYLNGQSTDVGRLPTTYDRVLELRSRLQSTRILLVLDGFERQLRDYASLNAAYRSDNVRDRPREARSCVDPNAGRLLRDIAAGTTRAKILLTTRLPVSDLEDQVGDVLSNVLKRDLNKLAENDAIAFMHAQGVRKGTTTEIVDACAIYGNHPLSLRLLSGLITRDAKTPGDITAAPRHDVHDDLIQRQHHVLEQSFNVLRKRERALISRIAAFRRPMPFEVLDETLRNPGEAMRFEHALTDLQERGLLQRDLTHNYYDLHPIVRHYCYHRLKDKVGVHTRLHDYFAKVAIPVTQEPESLEDLQMAIELYHHTVGCGNYDSAWFLLSHHLATALHFQFGAYQVIIELVRALFPDGENQLPRLSDGKSKAWALAELANMYSVLGKPREAIQLFSRGEKWTHTDESRANLLTNLASEQIKLGDLQAAYQSLERSVELRDLNDSLSQAHACDDSALLLTYKGEFAVAESIWKTAQAVFDRYGENKTNYVSLIRARRSWLALLTGNVRTALELAREARQLANGTACGEPDVIRADWRYGAALVREKDFDSAAGHLEDALTRCRRINRIDYEAELLLEWARWHRARGNSEQALLQAAEALTIANRCEYRLTQADIHNLLALLALDGGKFQLARHHATIAKERAWCNGPPQCFKAALDEAEAILKRLNDAAV
jgi:tetratricopeptide (TPR) repeat protein